MCQTNLPRRWIRNSKSFQGCNSFTFSISLFGTCSDLLLCCQRFLEVNAWNVCLFHVITLALISKTVLCHAHFTVANLREILRMMFFKYRFCVQIALPIRRRETKCWLCPSLFQTAMFSLLGYRRFTRFLIVALSDMALVCCWFWHYVFRIASISSSLPLPVPLPLPIAATFSVANHGKFMWLGL
jgi:hypothetical protein